MTITISDQSETQFGVMIGDRFKFVSESTYQFFNNYSPDEDVESPDYEGTEDHPDVRNFYADEYSGEDYHADVDGHI